MPASLDSFCIGAILAYGKYNLLPWYQKVLKRRTVDFFVALIVFIGFTFAVQPNSVVHVALYYTIISIFFAVVIMSCSEGVSSKWIRPVLENGALVYVGKISYGLYLFHNFIPYFYGLQLPEFLMPFSMYIAQGLRFLSLIVLASFSWFVLEKQALKLKSHFEF